MPNPLKSINTAIHKIKDGLESPGNGHGHSASPATSGHAHGDLAPSSGNGTPRPSVDAARHSESSPRASGEYQRSGTGLQAEELKGHLSRIFHIGGSQRKASHGEHSDAPTPKLDTPPHDGSTTPTKALEAKRLKEEARLAREQKDKEVHEAAELKHKEAYEADPLKAHYGAVPLAARERTEKVQRDQAIAIGDMEEGKEVVLRARIHHIRNISAKVAFIIFRQQMDTIQGVFVAGDALSENMIKWACRLDLETVVLVRGIVQAPKAGQEEIKSTSVHNREILVKQMHVLGTVTMKMAFHPDDIDKGLLGELDDQKPRKHSSTGAHTPASTVGTTAGSSILASSKHTSELDLAPPLPLPGTAAAADSAVFVPADVAPSAAENIVPIPIKEPTVADQSTIASITNDHFTPATPLLNKHTHAASKVGYSTRLENRLIDLRSDVSQAVFRIQAGIAKYFRRHLDDNGFMEIHTSKFQGGATESGASVFKVDYFGRTVFLAQSPQLGKQMAIAADMERVYEIGPVFRAENSNTHRHLTEFTGLDLEMAIEDHYHEVVDMLDGALRAIFHGLQTEYRREIETVRKLYPSEDLVFPEKTVRLHFADGVQMLRDAGWTDDGHEIDMYEDFSTRTEKKLGDLVKEKYGTDYYILDKFPASARPFYTMPDPDDPKRANACDFFIRGEEILSGGQRIHEATFLEQRMKECGINPDTMKDYVDGFRQGCPPHGGGGIGLERVVFLFLKLGNIRWGTMFPRDPRSFPKAEQDKLAKAVEESTSGLLGPTASTIEYEKQRNAGQKPPLPKMEDLIAAYGDSPNTSWLDPFWTVWHHEDTGACCGYAASGKYAVIWGRPLCDDSQIHEVAKAFTHHLKKEKNLKPIWACIDEATEQVLLERMGWKCVVAVAEQRVDPVTLAAEGGERAVRHKANRAQKEGVTVTEKEDYLSEEEEAEIVIRLKEWQQNRHGTQIYSAGLRPFVDKEHRRYFVARSKENEICGLVVLAQLAKEHGFQVKYSLDFPNAPPGTIELIVTQALQSLGRAGVHAATFGGSAPDQLKPMGGDWGWSAKMLTKSYSMITKTFRLQDKAGFREKFGTKGDPQYVAYPPGGLGLKGIEAIMDVLKAEK